MTRQEFMFKVATNDRSVQLLRTMIGMKKQAVSGQDDISAIAQYLASLSYQPQQQQEAKPAAEQSVIAPVQKQKKEPEAAQTTAPYQSLIDVLRSLGPKTSYGRIGGAFGAGYGTLSGIRSGWQNGGRLLGNIGGRLGEGVGRVSGYLRGTRGMRDYLNAGKFLQKHPSAGLLTVQVGNTPMFTQNAAEAVRYGNTVRNAMMRNSGTAGRLTGTNIGSSIGRGVGAAVKGAGKGLVYGAAGSFLGDTLYDQIHGPSRQHRAG